MHTRRESHKDRPFTPPRSYREGTEVTEEWNSHRVNTELKKVLPNSILVPNAENNCQSAEIKNKPEQTSIQTPNIENKKSEIRSEFLEIEDILQKQHDHFRVLEKAQCQPENIISFSTTAPNYIIPYSTLREETSDIKFSHINRSNRASQLLAKSRNHTPEKSERTSLKSEPNLEETNSKIVPTYLNSTPIKHPLLPVESEPNELRDTFNPSPVHENNIQFFKKL